MFPPIPPWEGLHPLIVHFPIALLLVAPLFVLLAALAPRTVAWSLAALVLMSLGTLAAQVATATGEAAGELADRALPGAAAVLEEHEHLAERARTVFAILTAVYAALTVGAWFARRKLRPLAVAVIHLVFLALYLPATLMLANAAHQGGRLVHELGVRSIVAATPGAPDAAAAPRSSRDDD